MNLKEWRRYVESQIEERKRQKELEEIKKTKEETKKEKKEVEVKQIIIKEKLFNSREERKLDKENLNRRQELLKILMDPKLTAQETVSFLNSYKKSLER